MSLLLRELIRQANLQEWLLSAQLNDFTQEQSLLVPPSGGNCANWIVGHVNLHRRMMLTWAGIDTPWDPAGYEPYERGSEPLTSSALALDLPRLLADFAATQPLLIGWLATMTEETMTHCPPGETRDYANRIAFYLWHEAYHLAQLEPLRRLAGFTEKVIG